MSTKVCTKCGAEKPLSEFYKSKATKDGLQFACKDCYKEYARKYYIENREKLKEEALKYRTENPEKVRESNRKWQAKNPEKVLKYNRKWQAENPEKVRERQRKYKAQQCELTAMGQVMDLQEFMEGLHENV